MTDQSEIDRLDRLNQSTDPDTQFLIDVIACRTQKWMRERDEWNLLMIRIGKPLGCLGSCFPDGNAHIVKAANRSESLRNAVKPFIEHAGDVDYWGQFGGDAWNALWKAYLGEE